MSSSSVASGRVGKPKNRLAAAAAAAAAAAPAESGTHRARKSTRYQSAKSKLVRALKNHSLMIRSSTTTNVMRAAVPGARVVHKAAVIAAAATEQYLNEIIDTALFLSVDGRKLTGTPSIRPRDVTNAFAQRAATLGLALSSIADITAAGSGNDAFINNPL